MLIIHCIGFKNKTMQGFMFFLSLSENIWTCSILKINLYLALLCKKTIECIMVKETSGSLACKTLMKPDM